MDKYIGKKLDGRYEITELIGVGGMAEVYKGVDVIDNKPVAIKILKKEYAENEEFLRRFRNESKAIAVLSHPNIVKIYDVGFSDKLQYIVMEYIDGITLKEYIEEEKVLTWKDTVHFVIQILRALQHAHDKGIVHRDIKPQNIMMFTDGTIKVMDFGIAKFAREEGKTATDQAIGSVHYISPEQASGNVTDAKSDIYSVGAMMYEMLTGRKPFDSDNPVAIAVMHMHDIPERPRAINSEIPDGLEEIVLRAMEKAPEDRYQTTAEMIADIDKFKNDPSITFGYYQEETTDGSENTRYFDKQTEAPVNPAQGMPAAAPMGVPANGAPYDQPMYDQPPMQGQQPYGNYPVDDYYDDEDKEDEEEERTSIVIPVLTAVGVVIIIVFVIVISMLLTDMIRDTKTSKNDYRMPDVCGYDFTEASNKWGGSIQFVEDGQEYNEAEPGTIIWQSIDPDQEFKKGVVLKVKVSKGMETEVIPNVADMNKQIAFELLTQKGFKPEEKHASNTDIKKDYVVKTEPEAGTEAHKGSAVIVYVSIGEDAGQVEVDNFVGMTIDDAIKLADWTGLKVEHKDVASYEKENTVVKQSIAKGEKVEKGSTIVLEYSNGKKPDGEVPFTIQFPGDADGFFMISFMIHKEDGTIDTQSSSQFYVPEMPSITEKIRGSGENVQVTVILNNLYTNQRKEMGSYRFNFADNNVSREWEDIYAAFDGVGGIKREDPPPPQQNDDPPANDREPGVNGEYDANGDWKDYLPGENGEWVQNDDGTYSWLWWQW